MYSCEVRITTAAIGDHERVKEDAEAIDPHHVPEGDAGRLRHEPGGGEAGDRTEERDGAQVFWPVCSSSTGSSIMTIMPKMERTISGRMRT